MTKTDIGIYRGLKEKFDPEVHVGFFITTDTGELLLGDQSLGQTISGWEINDGILILKLNTGRDIRVTFPEATETVKGLLSAADKAQLNALQANLDSKVDKVTGKSLLADSEITKLAGLPNSTELTNSIATAKAAGDNAQSDLNAHKQNKSNPHEVTKAQIGLGNVTNDAQVKRSEMGVANGVATLDADGKVPASQLPSYVDDIIDVYATYSKSDTGVLSNVTLYLDAAHTQLVTGEAGKIYQNIADGEPQYQFRWTGTIFSQTGASSLILGEVTGTAYDGAKGKANADNIAKIKGTSLSHIKDAAPVTTAADKVSLNYECFEGNQYGDAGTDHTADIPAATTAKAGVMSAADKTKLENLNSKLVVADEEDVTAVDGKIKFKDRDTTNGMGYKILRLPENGILTQDMISEANTIYEIRYNFDLNGATITIPENCTLKFEGGKLSNGTIVFNKTVLEGTPSIATALSGVLGCEVQPEWFCELGTWDVVFNALLQLKCPIKLAGGRTYQIPSAIIMKNNCSIIGEGFSVIEYTGPESLAAISISRSCYLHNFSIETKNGGTAISIDTDLIYSDPSEIPVNKSYGSLFDIRVSKVNIHTSGSRTADTKCISITNPTGEHNGWDVNFDSMIINGLWDYGFYCLNNGTQGRAWVNGLTFSNIKLIGVSECFYFNSVGNSVPHERVLILNCQYQSQLNISKYFINAQAVHRLTIDACEPWDWQNVPNNKLILLTSKCIDVSIINSNIEYDWSQVDDNYLNKSSIKIITQLYATYGGSSYKSLPELDEGLTVYTLKQLMQFPRASFKIGQDSSYGTRFGGIATGFGGILQVEGSNQGSTLLKFIPNHGGSSNVGNYIYTLCISQMPDNAELDRGVSLSDWIIELGIGTLKPHLEYRGSSYFNTATNRPTWYNGTEWIDPIGQANSWKIIR